MAGTTHYGYSFKSESGTLWTVAIKDTTYAGATVAALKPDQVGFNLNWEGATSETYQPIVGSTFEAGVYRDINSLALLEAIIAGIDCQFIVEITKTSTIVWRGFLLQDSMTKPDSYANIDTLKLKAVDGFGLLKDLDYDSFDPDALTQTTWINFFAKLMPHLPLHFIGAGEKVFATASVWYEDSMASGSGDDPLANTIINESAFIEVDSYGVIKALSYYDILTALLTTFNLHVVQWNGYYLIIQQNTYTQSTTRVWNYDLEGNYIDTEIMPLTQTMPTRLSGGQFEYILPLKEVRTEYDYKQNIYPNSLFSRIVEPGITYPGGQPGINTIVSIDGDINTLISYPADGLFLWSVTYSFIIRAGNYYLKKSGDGYEWTLTASYFNLSSRVYEAYSTHLSDAVNRPYSFHINIVTPGIIDDNAIFSFYYYYSGISNAGPDSATATPLISLVESGFKGVNMEGTELYKATTSNSARADLELEKAILGDGVLKYSAGALTINDNTSTLVKSNAWTIYSEIGGTAINVNSLRCREMLALRKSTVRLYSGNYKGIPNIHLAFGWAPGMNYAFNSINFACNAEQYSATVMGISVSRTSITIATPLISQDKGGSGGGSSSTGGGSSPESHSRLHNFFNDLDHDGTGGTAKTTPIDADSVVIIDSADSSKVKRTTWANVKATIGAYWSRNGGSALLTPVNPGDDISTYGFVKSQSSDGTKSSWFKEGTIYQLSDDAMASGSTRTLTSYLASGVTIWSNNVWATISGVSNHLFYNSVATGEVWTATSRAVTWVIQTVKSGGAILEDRIKILASGSFQIGNDTNNTTFDIDGKLRLNGSATVWDDLQTSGLSSKKGGSNDPVFTNIAGNIWIDVFSGTATNEVFFTVQFPHKYKEGSDIEPHVHWFPITSPATTKNVVWKLEYQWQNHDGTFGATNTTITGTGATGTVGYKGIITSLGVVSGTGKGISSLMICRLYRPGGDALDTYADGAAFVSCDMHYEIDALGSDTEYAK